MKSGEKYRHYKGKEYEIIGIGYNSETLEKYIIYKGLYISKDFGENPIWVRPYDMFFEKVLIDDVLVNRFTLIKEK